MGNATVSSVAAYFKDHIPDLTVTKRRVPKIGTEYLKADRRLFSKLYGYLNSADKVTFSVTFAVELLHFSTDEFAKDLFSELKKTLKADPEAHTDFGQAYFNDTIKTPLAGLKLILNLTNKYESFLYDEARDIVHNIHYEIIKERVSHILGEDYTRWLETHTVDCYPSYQPFTPTRIYADEDEKEHRYFNTWVDATWREKWVPEPGTPCPREVETFIKAFAKTEESARQLFAWLRDCAFGRAEPILVLCGVPGAGKNIFTENIAGSLVGMHNYHSAARGFSDSKFHAGVVGCRLFFLDEINLTPQTREVLKAYHNGIATVERKGKEIGKPEKIHASFVIANNHPQKIQLEYTDRKFYVPELSDTPLTDSLKLEGIQTLLACLKDDDYLKRLASYLYCNFEPGSAATFPKNDNFRRLCLNSYPTWFRRFIHDCRLNDNFDSRAFNRGQKHPVDVYALKDQIDHYHANFKELLADITFLEGNKWAVISKIYQGPRSANEDTLLV